MSYLCVLAGGAVGSLLRYVVGREIAQRFPQANFAWGTFFVNVTGSFFIGLLMAILVERFQLSPYWRLTLVVGFLGGYTTFSSFEYDAYLSVRGGHFVLALCYLLGSVAAGFCAVWLGSAIVPKHS